MTNNDQNNKQIVQRKLFAYYYWGCTLLWMVVIFCFSAYPHSDIVTKKIFHTFNFYVRKSAHMAEFGFLYFLSFRALTMSMSETEAEKHPLSLDFAAFIICLLYAVSDEWHQSFVPGRSAQPFDVLVDCCGVLTAALLLHLPKWCVNNLREPKQT